MRLKPSWVILIAILSLGLILRLYQWQRPLADWHSWRQADTASVTREFVKTGINLFYPTYHDLSNIPSGQDNPQGYRMVEFPFVNGLIALTYTLSNGLNLPLHVFSRLWAILFSLGSSLFLYAIIARLVSVRAGLLVSFIYTVLPFNIFFHTTLLPEVPLLFFSLGATYFWIKYAQNLSLSDLGLFVCMAALALLLKPIFVFYGLGLLYIFLKYQGFKGLGHWHLYFAACLVVLPFIGWRVWIHQFPAGIPASDWLFNGNNIRFKGAFFRWLFADRLGRLILGYWGLIPLGIGIMLKPTQKAGWFFHWLLLGMGIYLSVFATGNVTHDYYQIFIVPVIAIFVGLGLDHLIFQVSKIKIIETITTHLHTGITAIGINTASEIDDAVEIQRSPFHPYLAVGIGLISTLFMLAFSWFHIRDYFNINNPAIVEAGQAVDRLTPIDAKIIAPYQGDTAFLYQTNRSGWPIGFEIQDKIDQGATYYISTSYDDEARDLEQTCQLIEKTDAYILIRLECEGIDS